MPTVSDDDLGRLRTTIHATRLALGVYTPENIWTARVNGALADGATSITVTPPTQVRAPFKHCLVWFGTAAKACDLGVARWRSYSAPTLTVAPHNAALPDGAYITVKEEIQPEALHVALSATDVVYEDGDVAYGGENLYPPPLARIGPPAAQYRDPATGVATVYFYADPEAITPAATIITHDWDFVDGVVQGTGLNTSAVQGTALAPIAVDFSSAGDRYIRYTCKDSNNKTHTRYNPVLIYDHCSGSPPYTSVEVSGMEGDVDSGGWRCELRVWTDAPVTAFPDRAMVVLFTEDWYGSEKVSIGGQYTYRENVVLVGYIVSDSVRQDWARQSVEFSVEGIGPLMARLPGLGSTLATTAGTPTGWHVLKNMNYKLAAHHLLTQHSTISQIADVHLDLLTYTNANIDLPEGTLLDQLGQNICKPVRGRAGASVQGLVYLESNPQLLPLASRPAAVFSTTNPDVRDEIALADERHTQEAALVDLACENASAEPIFSLAPASAWGTGSRPVERVDGIRATNQAESNEIAGLWEGWINNEFGDVAIDWRGNYRVFDVFPAEAVQVNLTAAQNRRDLVWTNQRCWTKRVNYAYHPGGVLLVSSSLEKDSFGDSGITGEYPAEADLPDWPLPDAPLDVTVDSIPSVPVPDPGLTPGKGDLLYVATSKGVAECVNAYSGTASWSSVSTGLSGTALNVYGITFDPFSGAGGAFTRMYALTQDGLYKGEGFPDPLTATWTRVLAAADLPALVGSTGGKLAPGFGTSFATSPRKPGFIGVMVRGQYNNTQYGTDYYRWHAVWSLDYGATWNANTTNYLVKDATGTSGISIIPSAHLDDTYYLAAFDASGDTYDWIGAASNPGPAVYRSTDGLATFARISAGIAGGDGTLVGYCAPFLNFPYSAPGGGVYADDEVAYIGGATWQTGANSLCRVDTLLTPPWTGGYTPATRNAIGDATMAITGGGGAGPRMALFAHMWDENYLAAIETQNATSTYRLWLSEDRGAHWSHFTAAQLGTAARVANVFMVPADPEIVFYTGWKRAGAGIGIVGMTIDYGDTITEISRYGEADGIDTVMGLGVSDTLATVLVDYLKV